ncbi:MAG TPA: extracellular solute-binding protein [Casimicrobiaceae bacterium]|nr:extracellular solute-binding protein [Casimicrobiaceae bacterium]
MIANLRHVRILLAALALVATTPATAQQKAFADVGKQPDITVLIGSTPWYPAFEKVVGLYEQQTGNHVKLDVTPFGNILEKARNAVRTGQSPYDLMTLDTQWTIEFYEGGFVSPLADVDPAFAMPKEVFHYGDSGYWNAQKRWRTAGGGKLMAYTVLGNVQLLYYRDDVLKQAGLAVPKTWNDVLASCTKLAKPPSTYGFVARGEKGNGIRYDWQSVMLAEGAQVVKDPEAGDFTVTINSPQAKKALDLYVDLLKHCGPPNYGSLGQGDVIQLLATGKAALGDVVTAAFASFEDPNKSAVVGKLDTAPLPAGANGAHGAVIGNWNAVIPKNAPDAQKKAALAFSRWFLTYDAQRAFAEAGGIPNRSDVYTSDLAKNPKYRWMPAYLETQKFAKQELGYAEGAQVEQILGLRLNQALIGEMGAGKALNTAAQEIEALFRKNGRRTGVLPPLPE